MLRRLIRDFPMVHATVGLLGNALFVAGSVMFFERFQARTLGVWLFVLGSAFMLLGAAGDWLLKYYRYERRKLNIYGDARGDGHAGRSPGG